MLTFRNHTSLVLVSLAAAPSTSLTAMYHRSVIATSPSLLLGSAEVALCFNFMSSIAELAFLTFAPPREPPAGCFDSPFLASIDFLRAASASCCFERGLPASESAAECAPVDNLLRLASGSKSFSSGPVLVVTALVEVVEEEEGMLDDDAGSAVH